MMKLCLLLWCLNFSVLIIDTKEDTITRYNRCFDHCTYQKFHHQSVLRDAYDLGDDYFHYCYHYCHFSCPMKPPYCNTLIDLQFNESGNSWSNLCDDSQVYVLNILILNTKYSKYIVLSQDSRYLPVIGRR